MRGTRMTWRERALRAKASGWQNEDVNQWRSRKTCPAAEIAAGYGIRWESVSETFESPWMRLWQLGNALQKNQCNQRFFQLLPPEEFLRRLDEMEDFALELKRGEHA